MCFSTLETGLSNLIQYWNLCILNTDNCHFQKVINILSPLKTFLVPYPGPFPPLVSSFPIDENVACQWPTAPSSPETSLILTDAALPRWFPVLSYPQPLPCSPTATDLTLGYKTCGLLSPDGTGSVGEIRAPALPVRSGWVQVFALLLPCLNLSPSLPLSWKHVHQITQHPSTGTKCEYLFQTPLLN